MEHRIAVDFFEPTLAAAGDRLRRAIPDWEATSRPRNKRPARIFHELRAAEIGLRGMSMLLIGIRWFGVRRSDCNARLAYLPSESFACNCSGTRMRTAAIKRDRFESCSIEDSTPSSATGSVFHLSGTGAAAFAASADNSIGIVQTTLPILHKRIPFLAVIVVHRSVTVSLPVDSFSGKRISNSAAG